MSVGTLAVTVRLSVCVFVGLAMYLRADDRFDASLVRLFLRHLHSIESWFDAQSSYRFIASSLLFVYDGDAVRPPADRVENVADDLLLSDRCSSVDVDTSANCAGELVNGGSHGCQHAASEADSFWQEHARLKMIDFTHVFPVSAPDDNYLTGLRSIIGCMTRLKPGMYKPDV